MRLAWLPAVLQPLDKLIWREREDEKGRDGTMDRDEESERDTKNSTEA
jgi:hypothetical protein